MEEEVVDDLIYLVEDYLFLLISHPDSDVPSR